MKRQTEQSIPLNTFERAANRAFSLMVRIGLAPSYAHLLEVRGRRSGRLYTTPVNLLELNGRKYLVAPRGYTQWVKNVLANGEARLIRGRHRETISLEPVPDEEKPAILKEYLDRYRRAVQSFFPIPAGSPTRDFQSISAHYPVFELDEKR